MITPLIGRLRYMWYGSVYLWRNHGQPFEVVDEHLRALRHRYGLPDFGGSRGEAGRSR